MEKKNEIIIALVGPTGSGKTELAISLAKKFRGEIISADSRTVYQGLDIGTAKPAAENSEQKTVNRNVTEPLVVEGINHYLIDVADPKKDVYTVKDFQRDAKENIKLILKKGRVPFIVGGTYFYIKALLEGYRLMPQDRDETAKIRKRLEEEDLNQLLTRLKKIDLKTWRKIDWKNKRKVIRALEVYQISGKKFSNLQKKSPLPYHVLKIGLRKGREEQYLRIDERTKSWFDRGIIFEVEHLLKKGVPYARFKEFGLEYKLIAEYLKEDLKISEPELKQQINYSLHDLVRRQETWLRKDKEIEWVESEKDAQRLVVEALKNIRH